MSSRRRGNLPIVSLTGRPTTTTTASNSQLQLQPDQTTHSTTNTPRHDSDHDMTFGDMEDVWEDHTSGQLPQKRWQVTTINGSWHNKDEDGLLTPTKRLQRGSWMQRGQENTLLHPSPLVPNVPCRSDYGDGGSVPITNPNPSNDVGTLPVTWVGLGWRTHQTFPHLPSIYGDRTIQTPSHEDGVFHVQRISPRFDLDDSRSIPSVHPLLPPIRSVAVRSTPPWRKLISYLKCREALSLAIGKYQSFGLSRALDLRVHHHEDTVLTPPTSNRNDSFASFCSAWPSYNLTLFKYPTNTAQPSDLDGMNREGVQNLDKEMEAYEIYFSIAISNTIVFK